MFFKLIDGFFGPPTIAVPVEKAQLEVERELSSYIRRCRIASKDGGDAVGDGVPSTTSITTTASVPITAPIDCELESALSTVSAVIQLTGKDSIATTAVATTTTAATNIVQFDMGDDDDEDDHRSSVAPEFIVPFVPITLVCKAVCYYVPDPSGGSAPGVVKDTTDKEVAGKLQLLNR